MKVFFTFCVFFLCFLNAQDSKEAHSPVLPLLQQELQQAQTETQKMFPFETGKSPLENINLFQYLGVILVLVGLLAFLWSIKNRLNTPQPKSSSFNPLRKFLSKETSSELVRVESITTFGVHSRLIIFEAYQKRYLVMVNQNDIALIDSYPLEEEQSFKDMFKQDKQSNANT